MSDKPMPLWEQAITTLRFWVARIAIRFCGLPVLYWSAPAEWEEYMQPIQGQEPDE